VRYLLLLLVLLALPTAATAAEDEIPAYFFKFVDAQIRKAGLGERDGLTLAGPDGQGQINLERIARNCQVRTRGECKAEVRRFFEGLAELSLDELPTWEEAAPRLRLRVYDLDGAPEDYFVDTVRRPIAADLWLVVMLDSPRTTRAVSPSDLERWGQEAAAAFARARANHDAEPGADVIETGPPKADVAAKIMTGGYYLTSLLAWPERYLGTEDPALGWIILAPNRGIVFGIRVDSVETLSVAVEVAHRLIESDEGPDKFSLSPFWWYGGQLERLLLLSQEGMVTMVASPRMRDRLETLAGG